jgi:MFS family permease
MTSAITAPEGSRRPAHGTAAAALRHRDFRTLWLGLFASNIGTWMQTLVLPAYIADRTNSALWVGLFAFAQMGPLLLLSIPGGMLAERFPRKTWMIILQAEQLLLAIAIAALVAADSALVWLFLTQLLIGIGNALNAPVLQSTLPNLVDVRDLPGAISLNSVMINGSRVIGPAIAAVLMTRGVTAPQIFVLNAVTYLFVIVALVIITVPVLGKATDAQGWANVLHGVRIARRRTIVGRLLVGMALFSFLCLPYVGLFPIMVKQAFDVASISSTYKWLYAVWGLGACLGALSIGTFLAHTDKRRLIAPFFVGFAVSLTAFALLRSAGPAFPVGFLLGFCYFGLATSMLTVVQQNLRSTERARVMSLWFMAFGGMVSIGALAFGPIVDAIGARGVMLLGAVAALGLAWWCDVSRRAVSTLDDEAAAEGDQVAGHTLEARSAAGLDEHGVAAGE